MHLFDELWQAPECGYAAHPGPVFECRRTADHAARGHIAGNSGLGGDHHPIADKTMTHHSYLPASTTFFPTPDDPAKPTWEQTSVFSPTVDPCPTCTRLSILTPLAISVFPTLARSMQELA